jgi:heme-degrading monooxygenase HmoA
MFARTVVMQGTPDTAAEAKKIFAESVVPAAKQQTGFKGALFLTDPSTGKGMSVTLWETEADLKAGEESGFLREQVAKFGPLLVGPPTREVFVVAVNVHV